MSVYNTALGNSGPKRTFEHDGITYELHYVDQGMKAAIENHLYDKACDALKIAEKLYSREEFAEKRTALCDAYESGEFAFESKRGLAFIQSEPGALKIASLIFGLTEMQIMKLFVARMKDISQIIKEILEASLMTSKSEVKSGEQVPA